ncbi:MAG TPA: phosphatidylinositol mannoside acyltransferase [Acidothermaceae bacterium]
MKAARARFQAAAYAALAALATTLPESALRPLFRLGADVAWRRRGRGVRQLERNLRRVVGAGVPDHEFAALTRAAMRSYARYWLEFFRLPVLRRERIVGRMNVEGKERLDAVMAAGRGAILALPHIGNWDHAGAWVALQGYPFATVAERLKPESLFDRFVSVRERLGMEVIALTGGRNAFAVLLERLRAGKLVCLVTERDLASSGVEVTFFGESTTMPPGPAALAVATGAALFPVGIWFTDDGGPGGGWGATIHPEITPAAGVDRRTQIARMTQALADTFAADIAAHPQDWHMLQPLWPADRHTVGSAEPVVAKARRAP